MKCTVLVDRESGIATLYDEEGKLKEIQIDIGDITRHGCDSAEVRFLDPGNPAFWLNYGGDDDEDFLWPRNFTPDMALPVRRTSEYWLNQRAWDVMDPDGWDRKNLEVSWCEEISEAEFERRYAESTVTTRAAKGSYMSAMTCIEGKGRWPNDLG